MKLTTHAIRSLIVPLVLIFTMWATAFYFILSDELIDEVDDQLEVYSEYIIRRYLAGETLPDSSNGSNSTYYLRQIPPTEQHIQIGVEYEYKNIYVASRNEDEPARLMHTLFERSDGTLWKLTVITPVYERNEVISTILILTFVLLILMLLVVMAVFTWVFVRHTRPLHHILYHLDNYKIGNKLQLHNDTNVTEFRHLIDSVNDCINRIEEVYERERRFIGDAAHELQTPLAICQNRIEMMLEDDSIGEQQMIELAKIQQTISELIRLNRTLLFLSKIENNQFVDTKETCINEKVHHQADMLAGIYASKGITVSLYEQGQWSITANDELLTALVANLLRNAYLHNTTAGTIDIYIKEGVLSIANTGDDAPLDPSRLFDRFYKTHHSKINSNGLGLSIVKAICETSSLDIRYTFKNGKHIFTVQAL